MQECSIRKESIQININNIRNFVNRVNEEDKETYSVTVTKTDGTKATDNVEILVGVDDKKMAIFSNSNVIQDMSGGDITCDALLNSFTDIVINE